MTQRYSDELIESTLYFADDGASLNQKIVTGAVPHTCATCGEAINSGEKSLSVNKAFSKSGWQRCWICLDCCEKWIDKH